MACGITKGCGRIWLSNTLQLESAIALPSARSRLVRLTRMKRASVPVYFIFAIAWLVPECPLTDLVCHQMQH